ncbi:MAG: hypothetical protein CVU65_07480 [Deltaproteobacteria bacterium HGW-Deltaproteobacteria-22]|nr:MAG: hypothetical protein CVU65_07480 [Deltaproteobacteria bacterium HGW-Deltaproteobacteria-22]
MRPSTQSGSGLKTIILVLLNLLVIPETELKNGNKRTRDQFVFAFEELENNLHPALLRRLFQYLLDYVRREKCMLFLTTHSSVALDFFGPCDDAQFIHVSRKDDTSVAKVVNAHFDKLGVLSELGAKPSDLLQANGIIWVEGPSDRIYLNKWIQLFSDGGLQEGRDYQCAFYGGALLADVEVKDPAAQVDEMVNLIRVNPNIILVCDSDRTSEDTPLKDAVARIEQECKGVNCAMNWILNAKEIENYLPGSILEKVYGKTNLPDPDQLKRFFRSKKDGETSYLEKELGRKSPQKMDLALKASRLMTKENMSERFGLAEKMTEIVAKIREWNR